MKKIAMALILFVLVASTNAQGVHFGIKAGLNGQKIAGTAFKDGYNFGFLAGGQLEVSLAKIFGVQGEVLFLSNTNKRTNEWNPLNNINADSLKNVKLNYLAIPLLASVGNNFKVQAGVQYGLLLNKSETLLANGQQAFKSGDFSAIAGVQIKLPLRLMLSARYVVGLSDIKEATDQSKWKSQNIQVAVGLRL
jgi:hypothetical protein